MRLELFSPDLSNRHEITHAISSEFSDYYNDVGKFTVVLPMDDYNIGIVELDAVLYIVERRLAYTVEEIQFDCDNSEITLNGYSLNNKLNRRVIRQLPALPTWKRMYTALLLPICAGFLYCWQRKKA